MSNPLKNIPRFFLNGGIDGTMGVPSGTHGVTGGTLEVPWGYLPPKKEHPVCVFLYRCFYPHRSRYLVSSVCGIFMFSAKIAKKSSTPYLFNIVHIVPGQPRKDWILCFQCNYCLKILWQLLKVKNPWTTKHTSHRAKDVFSVQKQLKKVLKLNERKESQKLKTFVVG